MITEVVTDVPGMEKIIPVLVPRRGITDDNVSGVVEGLEDELLVQFMMLDDTVWRPLTKDAAADRGITIKMLKDHMDSMEYPYVMYPLGNTHHAGTLSGKHKEKMKNIYVLTNMDGKYGAGALASACTWKMFYEKFSGENNYILILPVSQHEVLVLPGKYFSISEESEDYEQIRNMLAEFNKVSKKEGNWISDELYYFDLRLDSGTMSVLEKIQPEKKEINNDHSKDAVLEWFNREGMNLNEDDEQLDYKSLEGLFVEFLVNDIHELCENWQQKEIFLVDTYMFVLRLAQDHRILARHLLCTEARGDLYKEKELKKQIEVDETILSWDYDLCNRDDQEKIIGKLEAFDDIAHAIAHASPEGLDNLFWWYPAYLCAQQYCGDSDFDEWE